MTEHEAHTAERIVRRFIVWTVEKVPVTSHMRTGNQDLLGLRGRICVPHKGRQKFTELQGLYQFSAALLKPSILRFGRKEIAKGFTEELFGCDSEEKIGR